MMSSLRAQIGSRVTALYKLCGLFGKSSEKESAVRALKHIDDTESRPKDTKLSVLLQPFFDAAVSKDPTKYWPVMVDCFAAIFGGASKNAVHVPSDIQERILRTVFSLEKLSVSDDIRMRSVEAVQMCLSSSGGKVFVHGALLHSCLTHSVLMLNQAENEGISVKIQKIIDGIVDGIVRNYSEPVPMPRFATVEAMSGHLARMFVRDSISIQNYGGGSRKATIRDVDMVVVMHVLAKAAVMRDRKIMTVRLACKGLVSFMNAKVSFLATRVFARALMTVVHPVLMILARETKSVLSLLTEVIVTTWRVFGSVYRNGMNELLGERIIPLLGSQDSDVMMPMLELVQALLDVPQFLVDCYVNYDCGRGGNNRDIFKGIMGAIIRRNYPNQACRKGALKTIVLALDSLWQYLKRLRQTDGNRHEVRKSVSEAVTGPSEDSPKEYADFLFGLASVRIATYVHPTHVNCTAVLGMFMENFDFIGQSLGQALRMLFNKVHLSTAPDVTSRIIEQFSAKFYRDNPSVFSCADTIYDLVYTVFHAHTGVHHTLMKEKVSLDEFVDLCKGIDKENDSSRAMITDLYESAVVKKMPGVPISVEFLSHHCRAEAYKERCTRALVTSVSKADQANEKGRLSRPVSSDLIMPIFDTIWRDVTLLFSVSFEKSEDTSIIDYCLRGWRVCIHIASHCYMHKVMDAIVIWFDVNANIENAVMNVPVRQKHISATRCIISTAIADRSFMYGAWPIVIREIAATEKLRENKSVDISVPISDDLFERVDVLDGASLVDFAAAVCSMVEKELCYDPPRLMMLLRVQEVCLMNLNRPLYIWKNLWDVVGSSLCSLCRTTDDFIAENVANVIKQTAQGLLVKDEPDGFHYNEHVLRPFGTIFDTCASTYVKKIVLSCVSFFVTSWSSALHSGWTVMLHILSGAVMYEEFDETAFSILGMVTKDCLNYVKPYFSYFVSVLSNFVVNKSGNKNAIRAVSHATSLASSLSTLDEALWEVLFGTIAQWLGSPQFEIMTCAEENLFTIIVDQGCVNSAFGERVWECFFSKTLFALISHKADTSDKLFAHKSDVLDSCFSRIFDPFNDKSWPYYCHILGLLKRCCLAPNDEFRKRSLDTLSSFVTSRSNMFKDDKPMQDLIGTMKSIAVVSTISIRFVMLVSDFISVFRDQKSVTDEMLAIMASVASACESDGTARVIPSWCAARREYQHCAIIKDMTDDLCRELRRTFMLYIEVESCGSVDSWTALVIASLEQINTLDPPNFEQVSRACVDVLCDMVEVKAVTVREALVPILDKILRL